MALRTLLLMLLSIPGSFGSLYCEFDNNFCDWKSSICHMKLIRNETLDGDPGYLLADANSCKYYQISQDVLNEEGPFEFRLKYFLRGPDPVRLSVETSYTMMYNKILWSTNNTDNYGWCYKDIVVYRGIIDYLNTIFIKVFVSGSSSVAIGSISKIEPFKTTTFSNRLNNSMKAPTKSKMSNTSLYIIGAAFALVILIITFVCIFCSVRK